MADRQRIVVAMSGGVDSSVAAALLVEAGHDVTGMMLRLWSPPETVTENRCCTPNDVALARRVAGQLGIPFYVLDARDIFYREVVQAFIEGYRSGQTPNPCVGCNHLIRWGFLLEQARQTGAAFLATGHYARVRRVDRGQVTLLRGKDLGKDQSYILSVLTQTQMAQTWLPLGDYKKSDVRALAKRFGLSVAEKAESQDLCFLGNQDYRDFLVRYSPDLAKPGLIVNQSGEVLGEHRGLAFYTIGQRKGLGVAASEPLYVIEKAVTDNMLIVGSAQSLGRTVMEIAGFNWISGSPPAGFFRAEVKIRYKASPAWATVTLMDSEKSRVQFDYPQRDITPGQRAVFYQDELVLGGGTIDRVFL